jgi:hypothetical protein
MRRRFGLLGLVCLVTQPCLAAHWQAVGPTKGGSPGVVYMDMDSVRAEDGYRVVLFLTIYTSAVPKGHNVSLDRITQETAFDCMRRAASLRSTVGYSKGKEIGRSSDDGDWKERFGLIPKDIFSQRALDMACNAPLAPQPEAIPTSEEAPGSVRLPVPGGATDSSTPSKP